MKFERIGTIFLATLMALCVIGAVCFFIARSDAGFRESVSSVKKEKVLLVCARQMLSGEEIVLDGEALTVLMAGRLEEISPGTKAVVTIEGERLSLALRIIWRGRAWTVRLTGTPAWQEAEGCIFWRIDQVKIGGLPVPYRWMRGLLQKECVVPGITLEKEGIKISRDALFSEFDGLHLEYFALREGKMVGKIGGISQAVTSALSEKLQELWEKARETYPELSSVQEFFEKLTEKEGENPSLLSLWDGLKSHWKLSLPTDEKSEKNRKNP